LFSLDLETQGPVLERILEVALFLSLFSVGLKLYLPLHNMRWWISLRLAIPGMLITITLLTLLGSVAGLSLGGALLLAAILAPTDPVLASDIQVERTGDRDKLRFGLTGESGLNDGIAMPFVLAGLALLQNEFEPLQWLATDLLWACSAGVVIGAFLGTCI